MTAINIKIVRPAKSIEESLEVVEGIKSRWSDDNSFLPKDVHQLSIDSCVIKCNKCQQFSSRKAKDIYKNPDRCGVCAGKIVIPGFNDALTHRPQLAKIWDYQKNDLSPEHYSKTSGLKVYLKCFVCNQSTLRQISNAVNNINGCAVCTGKLVIPGVNDLASKNPELTKIFSKKNNMLPEDVYYGGRASYWWDCHKCENSDFVSLARKIRVSGCGYCSNQKIKEGFNDLSTKLPQLLEHWDYIKNKESSYLC